jgi:hypothetical protein
MTINHPANSRACRRVLVQLQVIAPGLTPDALELAIEQDIEDSIRGYNYTVTEVDVIADHDPLAELLDELEMLRVLERTRTELAEARYWLARYEALNISDLLDWPEEV